jgi:hypothetical protein
VSDPFVRIPRRFVDACRAEEISVGAFRAGCWIACRADFLTGRYIVTIRELLAKLGREPNGSKTLRRQLAELHPRWIDFDVSHGQRKPWVITLTGLAPKGQLGHDLDKNTPSFVQLTRSQLGQADDVSDWEAAEPSENSDAATWTRPGQADALKSEEIERTPQTPQRVAGLRISKKQLRQYTGYRRVNGAAEHYVPDVLGTDKPPPWFGAPDRTPSQAEVLAELGRRGAA